MHWDGHPCDRPAAGHLQVLTRSQLDFRRALQKLLLHAIVVLLPTMVRKRRDIIKNESVVLGVELRGRIRRPRAPSGAIAVDELAKRGVVGGLLLRAGTNESQQRTGYRQRHIQQPAPSLGIFVDGSAYRCAHSVSPRNSGTRVCRWMSQRVPPKLNPTRPYCKDSYSWVRSRPKPRRLRPPQSPPRRTKVTSLSKQANSR